VTPFHRDLPFCGDEAAWIGKALVLYSQLPLQYQTKFIDPGEIITVLQGWDVIDGQIQAGLAQARKSGAAGVVVSFANIEQDWEPRIF
jgi:hypothetical protein